MLCIYFMQTVQIYTFRNTGHHLSLAPNFCQFVPKQQSTWIGIGSSGFNCNHPVRDRIDYQGCQSHPSL